jgi:hypothetical protein
MSNIKGKLKFTNAMVSLRELEEALPDVGDPCPACGLPLAWVRISRAEKEASVRIVGTRRVMGPQGFSYLGSHHRVRRR